MRGWGSLILAAVLFALWLHIYASIPVIKILLIALPFTLTWIIRLRERPEAFTIEGRERRAAEVARMEEEVRRQKYLKQQQGIRQRMMKLAEEAMGFLEGLPTHLEQADLALRKTQKEFERGYALPFWEAAERTVRNLGDLDACLWDFAEKGEAYISLLETYNGDPPEFPLLAGAEEKLSHSKMIATELQQVVREAHGDEKFASKYTALKVGQVLVEDFGNLEDIFGDLQRHVSDSLSDLLFSMDLVAAAVDESRQAESRDLELVTLNQQEGQEWRRDVDRRREEVFSHLEEMRK